MMSNILRTDYSTPRSCTGAQTRIIQSADMIMQDVDNERDDKNLLEHKKVETIDRVNKIREVVADAATVD